MATSQGDKIACDEISTKRNHLQILSSTHSSAKMQEFLREVNPRPSPRPHPTFSKINSNKPVVPDLSFAGSFKETCHISQRTSDAINPEYQKYNVLELKDPKLSAVKSISNEEKYINQSAPDAQLPMIVERVQKILRNAERRQQELQECLITTKDDNTGFLKGTDADSSVEQFNLQPSKVTEKLLETDHFICFPADKTDLKKNSQRNIQFRNNLPYYLSDPNVSFLLLENKAISDSYGVEMCPLQTVISSEIFDNPLKYIIKQTNSELNVADLPLTSDSTSDGCKCCLDCHCDSGHPSSLTSEQLHMESEIITSNQISPACSSAKNKKSKDILKPKTASTESIEDESLTLGDIDLNSVADICESTSCTIHLDLKEYAESTTFSFSQHQPDNCSTYSVLPKVLRELKEFQDRNFVSRDRNFPKQQRQVSSTTSSKNSPSADSFLQYSSKINHSDAVPQISNTLSSNDMILDSIIGLHPRHLIYNQLDIHHYPSVSDVNFSLQLNHLAQKYLALDIPSQSNYSSTLFDDQPETSLSFASKEYLKKHGLLRDAIPPTSYPSLSQHERSTHNINRILNIEHLKQQPKLL